MYRLLRGSKGYLSQIERPKTGGSSKILRRSFSNQKKSAAKAKVVDQTINDNWAVLKMFLPHIWPESSKIRMRVGLALGLLVGSKVLNVQVPWLFKEAVDALNNGALALSDPTLLVSAATTAANTFVTPEQLPYAVPIALLLGYGAARTGAVLFQELRNALFAVVTQNAIRDIATKTYLNLLNMDLKFHLSRDTGALSRAIDRGTRGISFVLMSLLFNIVPTILEIGLVSAILTHSYGASYAGITLSTLALYTAFTVAVTQWRTKIRQKMNHYDNQSGSVSIDALINYETVKYFNNEKFEFHRYDNIMEKYNREAVKVQTSLSFLNFGQGLIFSAAMTTVMVMVSQDITAGTLTIGDLVMINGLLFQLSLPLNFLGTVYRELKQAMVDMDILFSLARAQSEIKVPKDAPALDISSSKSVEEDKNFISFQNIIFKYEKEKEILNSVTFNIPRGSKVAIVGTSGGGKTTIFRLLYRFYDPIDGDIFINGQSIKNVTLESLRSNIAVVPQDMVLFNETIRYNVAYGNENATDEEIKDACRQAHIHNSIVKMHNSYDTIVGERGLKLSGGEKQRICLARALMKNAPILLLDEATSGLDAESEKAIQEALDGVKKKNTTVIMISHRLKTVKDADWILVFDKGRVVEEGTHNSLIMDKDGIYHNLVQMQNLSQL
eukprot:TRINITY_DN613_c0_g7_i1.p1 TRINITY_DN613_c0_g7~~TRINITY_DN613_c0_g7_i1.p1  ORF type:complete len:668 (-),score=122.63 TRINITY_DN613_c0_g7_i1:12-2015(-)